MKTLSLFSGGLDSLLAIAVLQEQGIQVIPITFVSYFFGQNNEMLEKAASQLGLKVEFVDFKERHLKVVKNPPHGFGAHMNPCIDCHAEMMKTALELLPKYNASFVTTGEVLGQRPMSQTSRALQLIDRLTGSTGLILRPLSALKLKPTLVEENQWVDRNKLLGITGRGRTIQMKLADTFGIKEYPSPAGGCALTVDGYSNRLKLIHQDDFFDKTFLFSLINIGRFFRFKKGLYVIISRNEEENKMLENYRDKADFYIEPHLETYGPHIVVVGNDIHPEEIELIKKLFSRYSKVKGKAKVNFLFNGTPSSLGPTTLNDEEINRYLIR